MANAVISDHWTFFLHHLSDYVPDKPGNKSDNHLNNGHDQPENGHHQVKDKLQIKNKIRGIERFSIECRKTKTKVITTANQNKGKYSKEPIRTQSKYK